MTQQNQSVPVIKLLVCWAILAAALVARAIFTGSTTPLIADTDDAMRLTMVTDFLHGQGWYDLVQHRLNTPFGGEIHWSRLIDAPEAALLAMLQLFAGPAAPTLLAYVWPLTLLLALLWLGAKLAGRLGGSQAILPALVLPAFSLITLAEFAPGRLDHHSAQILLTLAMLFCAIAALERPRFAIGAGLAAAIALAIGIEGLPMIVATALVFALGWIVSAKNAIALRDFGLSFALASLVLLAIALPPQRWLVPACDAISIVYVLAAILVGAAFVVLSLLPAKRMWLRLLAASLLGAVALAVLIALFPQCLKGPYGALDPWLLANWIDRIDEARPWWVSFTHGPVYPLAVTLPIIVAAFGIVMGVWRGAPRDRGAWLIYAVFLAIAVVVMLLQMRAARIATTLAIPATAYVIVLARAHYLERGGARAILGLVGAWLASAGLAVALPVMLAVLAWTPPGDTAASTHATKQSCLMPSAFTSLANLPPQRIMTPIDLGAHMLAFTPHAVVAAPYHRNEEAVLDAFHFFNQPITAARAIAEKRGVTLVVICPAMPEIIGLVAHAPDSFVSLYARDALPDWLIRQPTPDTPLEIYAIVAR